MMRTPPRSAARRRAALVPALAGALLGCSSDHASAPAEAALLDPVRGDGQTAVVGTTVQSPLVVRLHGASGKPLAHVVVQWRASGSGDVAPGESETDASGEATTTWTLDAQTGRQSVTASTPRAARQATFSADARPAPPPPPPPPGGLQLLSLTTYEGSGHVVHPDVVTAPAGWSAERRRLAITPYPYGSSADENPSIFSSEDGDHWRVPANVVNPIVRPPAGYLSDPDQLWVRENDEVWLYYRQVDGDNVVLLVRSRDGAHWTTPVEVVRVPNHLAISPAVVRRGPGDWLMWTVNGGDEGCRGPSTSVELRRSADGRSWSAPAMVALSQPGLFPWHIDVEWIANRREFWALYNAKVPGSCNTAAVYLATSPDGVTWTTYPSPVLARGVIPAFHDIVYRSSLEYDAERDVVTFWFSGANYDGRGFAWSAAVERLGREALFAQIQRPAVAALSTVPPAGPRVPQLDMGSAP